MSVPSHIVNRISMECSGTVTKWAGCVLGAEGICIMGSGNNVGGFVGVAIEAAVSGAAVALAGIGSYVKMIVGSGGAAVGDNVILWGASGRVAKALGASGTAYNIIGKAMEAGDTAGDEIVVMIAPCTNEI